MSNGKNLIVPINVQALCIGEKDKIPSIFAKKDADFSLLPYIDPNEGSHNFNTPNISENILSEIYKGDGMSAGVSLERGIHLHWTLPDALTRGDATKDMEFPLAPDRWIITRIVFDSQNNVVNKAKKSWVVESNALYNDHKNEPNKATNAINVLFNDDNGNGYGSKGQPYKYMGKVFEADKWSEKDGDYYQLTALGYGNVNFASSYQNCRSVFGFYDDMKELDSISCAYVVVGFYSDLNNDFIKQINLEFDEETKNYIDSVNKWHVANGSNFDNTKGQGLYSGFCSNIYWNKDKSYVNSNFNPNIEESGENCNIVFGNTGIEAFSVLLSSTEANENCKITEDQLNALQLGIIKASNNADLIELQQLLHNKRFAHKDGGSIWTIIKKGELEQNIELSQDVANTLNELNVFQQEFDKLNFSIQSLRTQIFIDWIQYQKQLYTYGDQQISPDDIKNFITSEITQLQELEIGMGAQDNTMAKCISSLQSQISNDFELKKLAAPKYYAPIDPTILIENNVPWNYAGERNKTTNGQLQCRITSQIIKKSEEQFVTNKNLPFTSDINALIGEAITLTQQPKTSGIQPEKIAMQDWGGSNPWLPLSIEWEIEYTPLNRGTNYNGYKNDHMDKFIFNDEESELIFEENVNSSNFSEYQPAKYLGFALLTPGVRFNLIERIKEYIKYNEDIDFSDILKDIENAPILAQTLNGFYDNFLRLQKNPQLPIYNPFIDKGFNSQVKDIVQDTNNISSKDYDFFNPIQDGAFKITNLRIIDAFGRHKSIDIDNVRYTDKNRPITGKEDFKSLSPSIIQSSRLSFRFLSASDNQEEMNSHPATTPICGWILINKINDSLMIYDTDGSAICSLTVPDNLDQAAILDSVPPSYQQKPNLDVIFKDKNQELKGFVCGLYNAGGQDLQDFIQAIDLSVSNIVTNEHIFSNPVLVGRALALVQTSLNLELREYPAVYQGSDALKNDIQNKDNNPLLRSNDSFTNVSFPIKLGDHKDFNDGLVGYFIYDEQKQKTNYNIFYSTASKQSKSSYIQNNKHIQLTPSCLLDETDKTKKIAMLIDPTATINAVSGILPLKSIKIPADQYLDALNNLYITFLTAPIISPIEQDNVFVPTSKEQGAKWSWIKAEQDNQNNIQWVEKDIVAESKVFSGTNKITEGWLKLSNKL